MAETITCVRDASGLQHALASKERMIEVAGPISGLGPLELPPGTVLRGVDERAALQFQSGGPGLRLTADNAIAGLRITTDADQVAVGLAGTAADLGTLRLTRLNISGRLHLDSVNAESATLDLCDVHVAAADARAASDLPAGFGVKVLAGGITVFNRSADPRSRWRMTASNLSGGSKDAPLLGSGVFIFGGATPPEDAEPGSAPSPTVAGGTIELVSLTTGEIHSNGMIVKGTPDRITGGVFIGSGVEAFEVVNRGPVSTYGVNDMVLDNWGYVRLWVAESPVSSFGDSGIGFVNFGDIDALIVRAPIETHGGGARGYNLYDGSLDHAELDSITTYGDGSMGVQLSKPFGRLVVHGDIRTKGGEGPSLVRGKIVTLKAHALSLKPGVEGKAIFVLGKVEAENRDIEPFEFVAPSSSVDLIMVDGAVVH
jgi:hypothetical protein